ncbi:hypothetical protein PAEPH01_0822 [Pancytospora epiphaga]|nr:hypothetical protein PAEPH01_0822 [Pancytospora epiphaga]
MLEGKDGYKYFGIIEDNRSRQSWESYTKLQSALYTRVKHLFNTRPCPHCKKCSKTVDHLATQCDRMLYHDYTRRHNEVVRCIHLDLKYIIYMYYHTCVHILFKR